MGLFGTSKRENELEKNELKLNDKIQELKVELEQTKQSALQESKKIELQYKKEILELGLKLEESLGDQLSDHQYIEDLYEAHSVSVKTIKMIMDVDSNFRDDVNIENLVAMGYGDQSSVENWFNIEEVPETRESGKDYIITHFISMLKRHYMLYQNPNNHVMLDELWEIVKNKDVSERMDQLAELNEAHAFVSSFGSWQQQYRMTLEDHNIQYDEDNEFFITSSLVSETMFRAMIRRM